MTADDLLQQLLDAYEGRVNTAPKPRPVQNTPWKPIPARERRTLRTYRDPTGETAVGNLNPKKEHHHDRTDR